MKPDRDVQPSDVGRIVHWYVATPEGASLPCAAMITDVLAADVVGLVIFHPAGMQFHPQARRAVEPVPLHWCWPPWTR
jgi:hypothetical protein